MEAIESGAYYLNLHIVTGRKACIPRAGDLLLNGTRQEMTALKYEAMARTEAPKSNQWKRFDLEDELTGLVHGLSNLSGAPAVIAPRSALTIPKTVPTTPMLPLQDAALPKTAMTTSPLTLQDAGLAPRSAKTSPAALASSSGSISPVFEVDGGDQVRGNLTGKSHVASNVIEVKLVESNEGKGKEVETVERVENVDA